MYMKNEKGSAIVAVLIVLMISSFLIVTELMVLNMNYTDQNRTISILKAHTIVDSTGNVIKRIQEAALKDGTDLSYSTLTSLSSQTSSLVKLYDSNSASIFVQNDISSGNYSMYIQSILNNQKQSLKLISTNRLITQPEFMLINQKTGRCVDIVSGGTSDGTAIWNWTCNGTGAQVFRTIQTNNGYFKIQNSTSNKVISIQNNATNDGASIVTNTDTNAYSQQFSFESVTGNTYRLVNRNSSKCIGIGNNYPTTFDRELFLQRTCSSTDTSLQFLLVRTDMSINMSETGFYIDNAFQLRNVKSNKCVDLYMANPSDGTNIWQYDCNNTNAQKFNFTSTDANQFEIRNIDSLKNMEVEAGSLLDGADIRQWSTRNTLYQQWEVTALNDSSNPSGNFSIGKCTGTDRNTNWYCNGSVKFNLSNKLSNKCMGVTNGSLSSGADLRQYECNGLSDQQFYLNLVDSAISLAPYDFLRNGRYQIVYHYANKCMDVPNASTSSGAIIQTWTCNNTNAQKFDFTYSGDGYYTISNVNSLKSLDFDPSSQSLIQNTTSTSNSQRFRFHLLNGNQFSITNRAQLNCIDTTGQTSTFVYEIKDGLIFKQNGCYAAPPQIFRIEPAGVTGETLPIGRYRIQNMNSGKCMSIANADLTNGAKVVQLTCEDQPEQMMDLNLSSNQHFGLFNMLSGKSIEVANASQANGATVQQWTSVGQANQEVYFVKTNTADVFEIHPLHSNKCLDTQNQSTTENTNLVQMQCNNQSSQQWKITPWRLPVNYSKFPDMRTNSSHNFTLLQAIVNGF